MSYLPCPHCGEAVDVFGSGGGTAVAESLSRALGAEVPLLGQVPIDKRLREGGDNGSPLVLSDPDAAASKELLKVVDALTGRPRGLAGISLGLTPAKKP
jgi:ATP-binding protein involved in chromosome partitioning